MGQLRYVQRSPKVILTLEERQILKKKIVVNYSIERKEIVWNDSIQLMFIEYCANRSQCGCTGYSLMDHILEGHIREIKKGACNVGLKWVSCSKEAHSEKKKGYSKDSKIVPLKLFLLD